MTDRTLVDMVLSRAGAQGDATWLRYLVSGDVDGRISERRYAELARRGAAVAAALQHHGSAGDRVLLLYPSGLEFVDAFFGCLFAGMIPVPAYPPDLARPERGLAKLCGIAADCGARLALTTSAFLPMLQGLSPTFPELSGLRCLASDACEDALADTWRRPNLDAETVALVQYTSGSTGAPKGAVLRHRQLLANQRSIAASMGPVGVVVGWLPIFHDMGLIGNVLQVLHAGTSLVLMSPVSFLKRPARWLEAITHYRADTSGGPNFAYDLCVRKVSSDERSRLDLRSWELAFCGAEPVREATFQRFLGAFEPHGFSRSAFYPCYGLAEATLLVAGGERGVPRDVFSVSASALDRGEVVPAPDGADDRRTLVSCGKPAVTEEVRIVDPKGCTLVPSGRVGEIWVRGPAVASGYWGRGDDDRAVFDAHLADTGEGPFLRTGDLGFFHDGRLYIAGRCKDVIILGGRNLFPQDIEATVEAAEPAVRKGCCAAFSVERDGEERLVIVAEHTASANQPVQDVVRAIKRAVAEQHQVAAFAVVLVAKGTIPKTSSGKLERWACREAWATGALEAS